MKLKLIISEALQSLFKLSLKLDDHESNVGIYKLSKPKIIFFLFYIISILSLGTENIQLNNYIVFLAEFISMQQITNLTHQIIVLICIATVHLIFIITSFNVKNIKSSLIRKVLQFYHMNYDWLFYIPSQTLCFKSNEFIMTTLSILVTFLSFLQFSMSIFIFRDSGFHTQNGRTEIIIFDIIFCLIFETAIILQLFTLPAWSDIKIFLAILILIIRILEFSSTPKFVEKNVQNFYQIAILLTIIFLCQQILVITFNYEEDPYLYTLLLIFPLLNFFYVIENQQIIESESFFQNILLKSNPKHAIMACQQIQQHKKNCHNVKCSCKTQIDINNFQQVIKFTSQLMKDEKPFNITKYLYFQILYNNKGFRNFLQITKIQKGHHVFSIYQRNIIHALLNVVQIRTKKIYKGIIPSKFIEVVYSLQWFESNQEQIKTQLIKLLQIKLNLWQQYLTDKLETYEQMFHLLTDITSQINQIKNFLKKFQQELAQYTNNNSGSLENNLFYSRVMSILEVAFYSVNKFNQLEKRIQKIIEFEQGQGDLLNYQMFENQKAMQILAVLSQECRGKIQKVSNKWSYLEKTESLSDFMPKDFYKIHDQLLENYCKFGPQRPQIFQTFIKFCDTPLVARVKICLNNFPNFDQDYLYLMGTIVKDNLEEDQDYILVNSDFTILGYSESLWFKLFQYIKIEPQDFNQCVFHFLPEAKMKLIEHYETMQQCNLKFSQHEKMICQSFNSQLNMSFTVPLVQEKNQQNQCQTKQNFPISPYERLQILTKYQNTNSHYEQTMNVQLSITEVVLKYQAKQEDKSFIYYWFTISFQDTKLLDRQFNKSFSLDLKIKGDEKMRRIKITQPQAKKSIAKTTSSIEQRTSEIFQFSEIENLISQITTFKLLILLSSIYFLFFLISFIIIQLKIQKKEAQQTQCFDYLDYSTSFLDAYGRAMIGSRHVIYLRDFNKLLASSNLYTVNYNSTLNVTSVDKISFSLYIYKQSIEELVQFYQDNYEELKLYDQNVQTVELKRINSNDTLVELQTIGSLSQYYKIMITTLYMAIKSFAKDPTLYLKGTTDTWAQVNTRSILYFNFKNVANLTLQFMIQCQNDDQMSNQQLDDNFFILMMILYVVTILLILLFTILYKIIKQKQKFVLSLFCRTTFQEGVEEIQFLLKLQEIIKTSKMWFGLYEEEESNDTKPRKQYYGKQIKSHIQDNLSNRSYWKFILPLAILSYGSLLIIQINYVDYSTHLSPIVTASLKTQYIRLLFLDTINNWDVYVNRKFYKAMIDIQPTATGRYKLYSENIRHGQELLRLINVDEEALKNNIELLQKEPFSEMIYSQTSSVDSDSLLSKDICLLPLFSCSMNDTVYKDRVHQGKMYNIYEVGIINLFKSSVQVINQNDFFDLTDNMQIIDAFERLEKSQEYFFYFLWGFDAFLYQMRLFSDYFIDLSKNQLSILTNSFYLLFIFITIITLLSILVILILGNLAIQQEFIQTIEILQQIPKSTIISKSLGKQLRQL